jgi:L-ascorbate metabolism protein UlaG (beta-lactamase superfamily)
MTDPVLDQAGGIYHFGFGSVSKKIGTPSLPASEIAKIDLVLLSHHQHQDNFDTAGKEFSKNVPLIISTKKAARKMANGVGLAAWESYAIPTEKVPGLKITATPAQHHPSWLPNFFAGDVIGFIIEFDDQPEGVIYISGDTVLFKKLTKVAEKFKIDKAILHLGSVQFRYLTGFGKFTMDAHDGIKLAEIIKPNQIIPIHTSGWTHFKEKQDQAREVFNNSAHVNKTLWLKSGEICQLSS